MRTLATLLTLALPATLFAAGPVTVIEAEAPGAKNVYRDERASGGQACVAMLEKNGGEIFSRKVTLPAGDYEAVFWVEPAPVQLIHSLSIKLKAGNVTRGASTVQFDPAPGYQPLAVRFFHPGGPCEFRVAATGATGFDGMALDGAADEQAQIQKSAASKLTVDSKKKKADELGDLDLAENPPISKLTIQDLRVACDKIDVRAIRTCEVAVTDVEVDKIHYLPGETVSATAKVTGLGEGGEYECVGELVTEADASQQVFSKAVTLAPGKAETVAFTFKLDPTRQFGHALRVSLRKGGKVVHDREEYFGVSRTVHRVGITGFSGEQNKRLMTPEHAAEVMQKNKDNYANYFECFAWAPSDFCDYTPDEELFWAGQSNFPGSISGFKNMLSEAHKRGIKGTSYSSVAAGGIGGYNVYRKFPYAFVTSDAVGMLSTYFLERAWHKEYNFSDKYEQISWVCWNDLWGQSSSTAEDILVQELAGSAKQLGWDGYRWDFWVNGKVSEIKKRVAERAPGMIWGYNAVLGVKQSGDVFIPGNPRYLKDLHEMCEGEGMLMDESVRGYGRGGKGPVRGLYEILNLEADYVKRLGGLPLIITFDTGSRLDGTVDVLLALAAGERYTYNTSPGDFAFGHLPAFLTRFSAFIWDDTARVADAGNVVKVAVGKGPRDAMPWWDKSTWLRKLPDGRQQLLVNLINPPGNACFSVRTQPPPPTLRDVAVTVSLPAGVKAARAFHVSPDLVEGIEPLPLAGSAGSASVTLPALRAWSIVAIDLAPEGGAALDYPALKLTTPLEDTAAEMKKRDQKRLEEETQKAEAEKLGQGTGSTPGGAGAAAPADNRPIYYQFDKTVNADADAAAKLKLPGDRNPRRDGVLDVHHAKGVLSWLNPIDLAVGLNAGNFSESYVYRERGGNANTGSLQDFPDDFEQLLAVDVLVLDNIHSMDMGPARRAKIAEYVKNGGSLLYFCGYHTLSCGHDHNTALAEVLPVVQTERFKVGMYEPTQELKPEKPGFFPESIPWGDKPVAAFFEESKLKPGVEVLVSAGGKPAVVASTFGKGRVITFLMMSNGDFPAEKTPFFQWKGYPRMLATCLAWLGQGSEQVYKPKRDAIALNPKEVNPANLAIDAALMEGPAFTKKLASAQKNMIDAATARTVLETALDNIDKIEDLALLPLIADAAQQYTDPSFAPLARKLIASPHTVFRRVGLQILGMSGEKDLRGAAEGALADRDPATQRAALLAIGRLGDPGSIAAVKSYLSGGGEKLLALGVLRRLGAPDVLAKGLDLYEKSRFQEVAARTRRMTYAHDLWGGLGSRISPQAYKELYAKYREQVQIESLVTFDNAYYRQSLKSFSAPDLPVLAAFFQETDTYRVASIAYQAMSRMPAELLPEFRKAMATAANPDLRQLSTP